MNSIGLVLHVSNDDLMDLIFGMIYISGFWIHLN